MHDGDQLYRGAFISRLKLTKNHLRSTMGQQRLHLLSLMCIESDILKNIDFQPIIKQFSAMKCRKFPSLKNVLGARGVRGPSTLLCPGASNILKTALRLRCLKNGTIKMPTRFQIRLILQHLIAKDQIL